MTSINNILSNEFINSHKTEKSPFHNYGLGEFVYKRTYARYIGDNTQEEWYQTIGRVVNGLYKIKYSWFKNHNIHWDNNIEQQEAKNMYSLMFNMKFLPGGRSLWAMGSPITDDKHLYAALNNCAAISTKDIDKEYSRPFEFLFDACMLGVGVGFDTEGAGKITIHKPNDKIIKNHIIEDSREGWVIALGELLNQYFKENQPIVKFDYSHIRPVGQKLKTFGGTSSGPDPLIKSFNMITNLLNDHINEKITSRLIIDIMNMLCLCVISGNVRRSASIAVGKHNDTEFMELKDYDLHPERAEYGWLSNNSVKCKIGDDYTVIAEHIKNGSGEPGIIWLNNMRNYSRMNGIKDYSDSNVMLPNPCGEISLEPYELCNLTEIFINRHTSEIDFTNTLYYAYLYAKIVSLCDTQWPETNKVIHKNRRLGISLTGIANFIENNNIDILRKWTKHGYNYLKKLDIVTSNKFNVNQSIKLTCIKPSGTISLMAPNTCSGLHYPTSRYYIRRVRINNNSKELIEQMKNNGYTIEKSITEPNTSIIDFVVDNKCPRCIDDLTMWEQLEIAAKMQEWWADNQVSCTISFNQNTEGNQIQHVLKYYQYRLKGISFLPKFENLNKLPQLPYEKIDEKTYNELIEKIKYNKIHINNSDQEIENYCTSESCDLKAYHKYMSKNIIFMNGITGSGKSFIAKKINDYLNNNGFKSIIISKDDFRYTDRGYIYEPEYEKIVSEKYNQCIIDNIKNNKFIILDNTHISQSKINETLELINGITTNIKFIIVRVPPYNDLEINVKLNNHFIDINSVHHQFNNLQQFNNTCNYPCISVERINNDKITIDNITKAINYIVNYFN